MTYAAALFERETVERCVGYLRRVLEGMVADESRRVDRLEIVPEDERRRVVEEWSRTEAAARGRVVRARALRGAGGARARRGGRGLRA